jgi:SulP family sulfate permease
MAGVLLVAMAATGLGSYVRLIPLPVVEGFTLGIAVIIALQQLPSALGVTSSGEQILAVAAHALQDWLREPHWAAPTMTLAVAATIFLMARLRPSAPSALLAVVAATMVARATDLHVQVIGTLPSSLPAPAVPDLSVAEVRSLLAPALAVAALAGLESLLSATVADAMTVNDRHDPDRELFGQGLANIASPLFGGIPATAAIARTAVNVRTGARSRLAAVVHAAVLLLVVLTLAPLVSGIPVAALAGVLVATSVRMVEVSSLRALLHSTRSDAAVLVVTFLATVALDLATAVLLGIVVAGALALRQLARTASLEQVPLGGPGESHAREEHALLDDHIIAFRLEGPLFFGGAHQVLLTLTEISDVRVVILRLSRVTALDATGAAVLGDTIRTLEAHGVTVMASGLAERFRPILLAQGVDEHLRNGHHLFDTTPEAIAHARSHVKGLHPDDDSGDDNQRVPSTSL